MTLRLYFGVAIVAYIFVSVICTDQNAEASSTSSASTTSQDSSSDSSASSISKSNPKTTAKKCRKVKKCPKNEEFSYCPQSIRRMQYCSEKGKSLRYPKPNTPPCKQGCVCKENYLRTENGTCIRAEQCKITCGPNEVLNECPAHCDSDYCPASEADANKTCVSTKDCLPPACKCEFNFRRAENGSCIPTRSCPPFDCSARPNEEYNSCPPICPSDDCSQASPTGECPIAFGSILIVLPCNPRCRCIKEYWRKDGICVPYGQCPGVCPTNERYSGCIQGECRALNCTDKGLPIACPRIRPEFCLKGCVCEENYLRAENGTCIPEDQCKNNTCPNNEEYVPCVQGVCRAMNCYQKGQIVPCPDVRQENCDGGCICKENFLRLKDGSCVPEDQCETNVCPANERYSGCIQGECRALNCTDKGLPIACPKIRPEFCLKGCVCEENYLRAENGTCIPENQCETNVCPLNEEFSECTQIVCRAQKCIQKAWPIACPGIEKGSCLKGCVCQPGYLRDDNSVCIPEDECIPNPCQPNEKYSNCTQAVCRAQYCTQKGKPIACPGIAEGDCLSGCVCQENYLRNEYGACIPDDQCTPDVCQPNEEWSECAQATCRAQNCTQKGKPIACPMIADGYCIKACVCKENYLRDENGVCVPEDQCPPGISCGENEVLDNCSKSCTSDYCPKSANEKQDCVQSDPCQPACKCIFNHRRADNGSCIPTRSCPPFDCSAKPNEEYNPCPAYCPTDDCSLPRVKGKCPFKIGVILQCNPKCQCKDGYGRSNGTCVPFSKCPNLCPSNEEYSPCTQATCRPKTCAERDNVDETCPAVDSDSCERGCVCQKGYYRNDQGDCVSYDKCPAKITCGENEVLDNCSKSCTSDYCPKSADEKQDCVRSDPCQPACKCIFNYRRADNGTCIPTRSCPPFDCSAKPNEEYDPCPALCPTDECSLPRVKGICPFRIGIVLPCNPKCQCKDGYGRSNGTCVPFSKCPNLCPTNEEYSPCTQATCRPQTCADRDNDDETCPAVDSDSCERGCVCQKGYYRNDKGDCVSYDECPAKLTCGDNEVLDNCSKSCTSDHCPKSANEKQDCVQSDPCQPACKCIFNHRRADNGTCIPTRSCPPFDCSAKPYEEYDPCPAVCPTDDCSLPRVKGQCPFKIGVVLQCNPKCQCKDGYGRSNGTCVPFSKCPDLCPTNEEYSPCTQATCQQICADRDKVDEAFPAGDSYSCEKGCVCQKGYYRNDLGKCVTYDECSDELCPNANEHFTKTMKSCPPNTCMSLTAKFKCDPEQKEVPGCLCDSGYLRLNLTSSCIPICECPQMANTTDCQ